MRDSPRLQAFLESLSRLSGRQWAALLALLICANLIVYAALGMLFYRYVLNPPPAPEIELAPTPTLRPTFTATWTPTSGAAGSHTPMPVLGTNATATRPAPTESQ